MVVLNSNRHREGSCAKEGSHGGVAGHRSAASAGALKFAKKTQKQFLEVLDLYDKHPRMSNSS